MNYTHILKRFFCLALGMVLLGGAAFAQATTDIELTVTNSNAGGAQTSTVNFGVNPAATNGLDGGLGEADPPAPPGAWYVVFVSHGSGTLGNGSPVDFRPYTGAAQTDLYKVKWTVENGAADYPVTITWNSALVAASYTGAVTIQDAFGGIFHNVNMKTANSVTVTNSSIDNLVISATGPQNPPSGLSISGCPMNFGVVTYPTPGTGVQTLTISNTGATPLVIDNVASDNAKFVVTSPTFPQTIAVGGPAVTVTITYTATAVQTDNAVLTITYNGASTTTCAATAIASSGEGLYMSSPAADHFDNQTGKTTNVGLKYSTVGNNIQGLQFTVDAPYSILRINSVSAGPDLPAPPIGKSWNFDYEVTNAVSGSSVQIVLYGSDSTVVIPVGDYDDLFRINYEIRDTNLCNAGTDCDSVQTHMTISSVESSLNTYLATTAGVVIDNNRKSNTINVYSSSARGDVNCDDQVNVLDILEIIDHIQDRKTLATWQLNRGDMHPWSAGFASSSIFCDGTNYGNSSLNVNDVVIMVNAILNAHWPSGSQLFSVRPVEEKGNVNGGKSSDEVETGKGGATGQSAAGLYDVKFDLTVAENGINVDMHNVVAVKGVQLFLKAGGATDDLVVRLAAAYENFTVSSLVVGDSVRILIYSLGGDAIPPSNANLMEIPFSVINPKDVMVIEPVIAGGPQNQPLKVEYDLKVAAPSAVPNDEAVKFFSMNSTPNPFTGTAMVNYTLASSGDVTMVVTDAAGKEVVRLVDGAQSAGRHTVEFNAAGLADGSYYCTLTAGGKSATQKLVLTR